MRRPSYGGQAVIEGVMMRGPDAWAVAVRQPDGSIGVAQEHAVPLARKGILAWPVVRGALVFVDGLSLGIRALMISADMAGAEDEKLSPGAMTATIAGALGFAIALFIVLPTVLMSAARQQVSAPVFAMNLAEGLLRVAVFVSYVFAISRVREIERVLEYHGAEHKVINTYDAGEALTLENVRRQSRVHPRCSTSFLMIVVVVGSLLFSFFGWPGVVQRVLIRLALLPLVAGLSYEIIRFSGSSKSALARAAMVPGTWLQKMTTREPDDDEILVAIASLNALIDGKQAEAPAVI